MTIKGERSKRERSKIELAAVTDVQKRSDLPFRSAINESIGDQFADCEV